jgi:hypothetical protein
MSYKCDCCGRESFRKIKTHGYILCNKHYKQFKKYGKFLDNNPRTIYDSNDYRIEGNIVYIDLYNKKCIKIAETMIDLEDLEKVKYTKWRISASGYAMNNSKFRGSTIFLHRVVLDTDQFVDHINHNKLDNRKENLRIVTKSQNQMNCNYKGIYRQKNGKYHAQIKINQKGICLGTYIDEEEALFARWYAETILFGEYRYPKEKPFILPTREKEVKEYVDEKVQRLLLSAKFNQNQMEKS